MNQSQVTKSKKWPNAEDAQKFYILTCIIVRIDCINFKVNWITLRPMTETSPLLLPLINGGWKTSAYRHLLKWRVKRLLLVFCFWPRRIWATATFRSSSSTIYPQNPLTTPVVIYEPLSAHLNCAHIPIDHRQFLQFIITLVCILPA